MLTFNLEWKLVWAEPCENASSGICLRYPLTELLDIIECISGEQMPGWYFAHARDESESVLFVCSKTPFSPYNHIAELPPDPLYGIPPYALRKHAYSNI